MTLRLLRIAVLLALPVCVSAQQQPSTDVLSSYLRRAYAAMAKDVATAVETMPEQDFGFRPSGALKEVRTFGEIASHLALVNSFVCAMGDGKPDLTAVAGFKPPVDKPGVVALIGEVNTRCTAYLATLTDSALSQRVTSGSGARTIQSYRGNAVMFAIAHANEHYGNLVTYLRANGLVPPSTPAQSAPFGLVTPPKP